MLWNDEHGPKISTRCPSLVPTIVSSQLIPGCVTDNAVPTRAASARRR